MIIEGDESGMNLDYLRVAVRCRVVEGIRAVVNPSVVDRKHETTDRVNGRMRTYVSLWIGDDRESEMVIDFLEKNAKSIASPIRGFELGRLTILIFNVHDKELSPFLYDIGLAPTPRLFISDEEIRGAERIIKLLEKFVKR